MVETPKIPSQLMNKIIGTGHWNTGWKKNINDDGESLATRFRLRNGRNIDLVVDRSGNISLLLNPLFYTRGEPVDPELFDFNSNDIVALIGRRKVNTGWFPWQYRWEDYDLVSVE